MGPPWVLYVRRRKQDRLGCEAVFCWAHGRAARRSVLDQIMAERKSLSSVMGSVVIGTHQPKGGSAALYGRGGLAWSVSSPVGLSAVMPPRQPRQREVEVSV